MNQMNSGDADLDRVQNYLDGVSSKMGLNGIVERDVDKYLDVNEQKLSKLSPEECYHAAFVLKAEALYVQTQLNRLKSQLSWGKSRLSSMISPELSAYGGKNISFETQRMLAIKNNAAAYRIYTDVIRKAESLMERLEYIPNNLKDISDTYLKYAYHKTEVIKNERNENK